MEEAPVTCQYVFTDTEYRRIFKCLQSQRSLTSRLVGLGAFLGLVLLVTTGLCLEYREGKLSDENGLKWGDVLSAEAPFGVGFAVVFLFNFTPLTAYLNMPLFWFSPFRNKQARIALDSDQVWEIAASRNTSIRWSEVPICMEDSNGFVIRLGKVRYYWLPKHGFYSLDEVDRCRDLIQARVAKFHRTG